MTIGPEPRIRILEMSVRLGIRQFSFWCFEGARLQARRPMSLLIGALAPAGPGRVQIPDAPMNIDSRRLAHTDVSGQGFHGCIECVGRSLQCPESGDPEILSARPPYSSPVLSLPGRRSLP